MSVGFPAMFPLFLPDSREKTAQKRSLLRLTVRGVKAGEDLRAGAELGLAEPVERRLDGL